VAGLVVVLALLSGCAIAPRPGTFVPHRGDEIVAAGRFVHTGTSVVLWMDPGGYDAYRVERRFSPLDESSWETSKVAVPALDSPNRYGLRRSVLTPAEAERVRGGGWDLPLLQKVVDQFVIHYDATGTSRQCFKVLHDLRGLSVHFLLDLDGTLYQTLDLKERAWHATSANSRAVGIEIANIGAYPAGGKNPFGQWYEKDAAGCTRLRIPERLGDGGLRTAGFVGRPARPEPVEGSIQGTKLVQYDYTPEQYAALTKLIATLCRIFPKMRCDYPRDGDGQLVSRKLPDAELEGFGGLIGHFHVQTNKVDPGPAFQWDPVVAGARRLIGLSGRPEKEKQASALMKFRRAQ
jgi:N-acetylmuramoyl-L-alanine amidase